MREEVEPHTTGLKIAVLDHTAALGGAELALVRLAEAIDPSEVELHVLTFSEGPLVERVRRAGHAAEVVALPQQVVHLGRESAGRLAAAVVSTVRLLPFLYRLSRRLRDIDVDVIHTTSLKADLVGVPVSFLVRRPLVWHVHDRIAPDYLPARLVRLLRVLARTRPAAVIANSDATAATLPGVEQLTVARPGLAADQLRSSPRGALRGTSPVIGVVGRLSPTKAQLAFVRAAALVAVDYPDARFRVVGAATFGTEDYERRVRAEVAHLGLTDRVEFTGFVSDPRSEFDAMSVCVHTAAVPEPFGQVVAEAMARGVPVVATAGGGVDEIVRPTTGEDLGWLVPPGDERALAAAINDVLASPGEADRRARLAWESVQRRLRVEQTAATVVGVWRQVASSRQERS